MTDNYQYCLDLSTVPRPETGKVLVTGATGYVGGRLIPELIARGYSVRIMLRKYNDDFRKRWPGVEIAVADALDPDSLNNALDGIHTAYYLIHSLLLGRKEFELKEIQAANNFSKTAVEKQIKRIIYLGGLGDTSTSLSPHLRSRTKVAKIFSQSKVPTTILRAAVIVGSGSASYELIMHLVKNCFIIPIPGWAKTVCQPVAIRDVIKYLVGVLELPETSGKTYDIGGSDILSYESMLRILAGLLGKKVIFIPSPFPWILPYAYFANLFTPVSGRIISGLLEGTKNEVICQSNDIKYLLPFKPLEYREAVVRAMTRDEQDDIHTRWSDAYPPAHSLAIKLHELEMSPQYTSSYSLVSEKTPSALFESICMIGGKKGWFNNNWMWRLRGILDKILMGAGTDRGRRSPSSLRLNDTVDFWRVENIIQDKRLLLRAEMKLPGRAWLEFLIDDGYDEIRMSINAYYQPRGIFGKIYWYIFLPFHYIIFQDLIEQIEKRA